MSENIWGMEAREWNVGLSVPCHWPPHTPALRLQELSWWVPTEDAGSGHLLGGDHHLVTITTADIRFHSHNEDPSHKHNETLSHSEVWRTRSPVLCLQRAPHLSNRKLFWNRNNIYFSHKSLTSSLSLAVCEFHSFRPLSHDLWHFNKHRPHPGISLNKCSFWPRKDGAGPGPSSSNGFPGGVNDAGLWLPLGGVRSGLRGCSDHRAKGGVLSAPPNDSSAGDGESGDLGATAGFAGNSHCDLCKPLTPLSSIHILRESVVGNTCSKWARKSKRKVRHKHLKSWTHYMNEQRCFLPQFWLCLLTGPIGGASIEKHHFQTPILRMTSVSKNSLTTFPQCQHHSFLTYLQFRTALVQQLDMLFLSVCLRVCFWQRSRAWKRWESMWQRRRRYSWPTPQAFQGRVDSKAKKSRGQYSFPFVRCGFWTRLC